MNQQTGRQTWTSYRVRPHSTTGISPMEAMTGWMPRHFLIEDVQEACELIQLSQDVTSLSRRSAWIRDLIEEELSACDIR